jgi:hypothetical protein
MSGTQKVYGKREIKNEFNCSICSLIAVYRAAAQPCTILANGKENTPEPLKPGFPACFYMFLSGFEPLAFRLGGGRSILLSYRNTNIRRAV